MTMTIRMIGILVAGMAYLAERSLSTEPRLLIRKLIRKHRVTDTMFIETLG